MTSWNGNLEEGSRTLEGDARTHDAVEEMQARQERINHDEFLTEVVSVSFFLAQFVSHFILFTYTHLMTLCGLSRQNKVAHNIQRTS